MELKKVYAIISLTIIATTAHCARIRRVVGGKPLSAGEWPWLVSLNYQQHHEYLALQGLKHLCGGTLIHESWVLTAAHCVHSGSGSAGLGQPKNWIAVMGEYNRQITEDTEQRIEISEIFLGNYTVFPKLSEDIALLKLKTPARITELVRPIALDYGRDIPTDTSCLAGGWGQHTSDEIGDPQYGNGTMVPHVAQVKRVSQATCHEAYSELWPLVDNRVLCFNSQLNQDTCKGDSGGPLVCNSPEGMPVLTGVVSVGMGCALEDYPGIYTRVSWFREWILGTIANN